MHGVTMKIINHMVGLSEDTIIILKLILKQQGQQVHATAAVTPGVLSKNKGTHTVYFNDHQLLKKRRSSTE